MLHQQPTFLVSRDGSMKCLGSRKKKRFEVLKIYKLALLLAPGLTLQVAT